MITLSPAALNAASTFPIPPLEDATAIREIVRRHLMESGAYGVLPTPVHQVMAAHGIRQDHELGAFAEAWAGQLPTDGARLFLRAFNCIKGLADLKRSTNYLPSLGNVTKELWRDAHELIHQILKWHRFQEDGYHIDDKESLSEKARHWFEIEANFGAGELVFQSEFFLSDANDTGFEFDEIVALSKKYGASISPTFRRYIGSRSGPCAGVTYLTNDFQRDEDGRPPFHKPLLIMSPAFAERDYDWQPPQIAPADWAAARALDCAHYGELICESSGDTVCFEWHSFWNTYQLMILLRPKIASARRIFLPSAVPKAIDLVPSRIP
jgi:hypothetical protein